MVSTRCQAGCAAPPPSSLRPLHWLWSTSQAPLRHRSAPPVGWKSVYGAWKHRAFKTKIWVRRQRIPYIYQILWNTHMYSLDEFTLIQFKHEACFGVIIVTRNQPFCYDSPKHHGDLWRGQPLSLNWPDWIDKSNGWSPPWSTILT